MNKKFKAWERTGCDHCGSEFLVARAEPREIVGDVICSDCDMHARAFKEGAESVTNKGLANTIRLNMLAHAFNEYQMTVSNITTHTDSHLIRIGNSFKENK